MFLSPSNYTQREEDNPFTVEPIGDLHTSPIGNLSWLSGQEAHVLTHIDEETITKQIDRDMVDVLGATVEQDMEETLAYRRRGEETLTWGEPEDWIVVQWLRSLSQYSTQLPSALVERLRKSYTSLQEALESARFSIIGQYYELRNEEQVRDFLRNHPTLVGFLIDSYPYLHKHFGDDSKYILEAINYPEGSDFESLVVFIATSLSVDEALSRLDAVDREWYLDQLDLVGELVNFNLEMQ